MLSLRKGGGGGDARGVRNTSIYQRLGVSGFCIAGRSDEASSLLQHSYSIDFRTVVKISDAGDSDGALRRSTATGGLMASNRTLPALTMDADLHGR